MTEIEDRVAGGRRHRRGSVAKVRKRAFPHSGHRGDLDETIGIVHLKQIFTLPRSAIQHPIGGPRPIRSGGSVDARR